MTDDLIERTARAGADVGLVLSDEQWRAAIAIIAPAVLDMAADACDALKWSAGFGDYGDGYIAGVRTARDELIAIKAQFEGDKV